MGRDKGGKPDDQGPKRKKAVYIHLGELEEMVECLEKGQCGKMANVFWEGRSVDWEKMRRVGMSSQRILTTFVRLVIYWDVSPLPPCDEAFSRLLVDWWERKRGEFFSLSLVATI